MENHREILEKSFWGISEKLAVAMMACYKEYIMDMINKDKGNE